MKLGISNLAWDNNTECEQLIPVLKDNNINYIEIVFPKHLEWNNPYHKLDAFMNIIEKNNLKILSTQSIFFNSNVNNFYGEGFLKHLELVSNLSKEIGVNKLVLGSPNMRIDKNYDLLFKTFEEADKLMLNKNLTLLLEPNCKLYKGEFFHTVSEIVDFIKTNNFKNISTMIDTHNILLENENPVIIFNQYKDYIKHIHISEEKLDSFIESDNHNALSELLTTSEYNDLIIYEAKLTPQLKKDIKLFSKTYNK